MASARHCAVCRRYKGVKIEVHHIKPKNQGGKDTFENAIPLCFDCHSDAGHYFANHPKGTKFSPAELKKHKKEWFRIVQIIGSKRKTLGFYKVSFDLIFHQKTDVLECNNLILNNRKDLGNWTIKRITSQSFTIEAEFMTHSGLETSILNISKEKGVDLEGIMYL